MLLGNIAFFVTDLRSACAAMLDFFCYRNGVRALYLQDDVSGKLVDTDDPMLAEQEQEE